MSSGYYRLGANVPGKKLTFEQVGEPVVGRLTSSRTNEEMIKPTPPEAFEPDPRAMGYTGDTCTNCQGSRVRNNGTCKVCDDCGTTTGCS